MSENENRWSDMFHGCEKAGCHAHPVALQWGGQTYWVCHRHFVAVRKALLYGPAYTALGEAEATLGREHALAVGGESNRLELEEAYRRRLGALQAFECRIQDWLDMPDPPQAEEGEG